MCCCDDLLLAHLLLAQRGVNVERRFGLLATLTDDNVPGLHTPTVEGGGRRTCCRCCTSCSWEGMPAVKTRKQLRRSAFACDV